MSLVGRWRIAEMELWAHRLDVEWAHANAPGAAIDLVVVPDSSFQHLLDGVASAVKLTPAALSMSWGTPESDFSAYSCTLPGSSTAESCQAAYENEFQAAGTATAYDGTHPKTPTVNYPASSPEVAGVGGTTINVTAGAWSSETAWSDSGGGYSNLFPRPSYQSTAKISDPSRMRGVPDVAFDANVVKAVEVTNRSSLVATKT